MYLVDYKLIEMGKSDRGGWNRKQLAILGISWPPYPGWQRDVIGKVLEVNEAVKFVALTGQAPDFKRPRKKRHR